MSPSSFTHIALSFPGTERKPHFDRTAFRVIGKKIFATLHEPSNTANMVLTISEQATFCDYGEAIYPVPNKFGLKGWTTFELDKVPEELMREALLSAYNEVVGK